MRVRTSICTTAGATWSKMSAKERGAPWGGAKAAPATPELGMSRPLWTASAWAPGHWMTPPAVAAAARNRRDPAAPSPHVEP